MGATSETVKKQKSVIPILSFYPQFKMIHFIFTDL